METVHLERVKHTGSKAWTHTGALGHRKFSTSQKRETHSPPGKEERTLQGHMDC